MFDSRAAELHTQAIEALSDLRVWIWARHAALLPDDLAAVTREEAEHFAAVLDWYSRVEDVLRALAAAGSRAAAELPCSASPPGAELPVALRAPPVDQLSVQTLRGPGSDSARGWQRTIPVLADAEPFVLASGSRAA